MAISRKLYLEFFHVGLLMFLVTLCYGYGVNENLFFQIVFPPDISYVYMIRPAKTFGGLFSVHDNHRIGLVPSNPIDGCYPLENAHVVKGAVALTKRGGCSFLSKTLNAESAGAIAVFIYDSDFSNDNAFIDMIEDGTDRAADIPAAFLLGRDGQRIMTSLQQQGLPGAEIVLPVNITGIPLGQLNTAPWSLW